MKVLKCLVVYFYFLFTSFGLTNETITFNTPRLDGRIINGYPAEINNTKHQVSIRNKKLESFIFGLGQFCSGSLISPNGVLTAAHCLIRRTGPLKAAEIVIGMGTLSRNVRDGNTLVYNVKDYVLHPNYDNKTKSNDIAYILLDGRVPINHPSVQPIQLISCMVAENTLCHVTGWGITEKNITSDHLLEVKVQIIDINTCNSGHNNQLIMEGQLCAGYMTGGNDACFGDSGGPLVCNGKLTGIVSLGDECGKPNKPGIYTDVLFFHDWIPDVAVKLNSEHPKVKCGCAKTKQLSFVSLAVIIIMIISKIF